MTGAASFRWRETGIFSGCSIWCRKFSTGTTAGKIRYLGVTEEDYLRNKLGLQLDTQSFDVEKMATFLSLHDMSTHVREPLLLDLQGKRTLSVNIFDQEEYLGCLTVFEGSREFRDSDKTLAVFFFSRIPFWPAPALRYAGRCAVSFPGRALILSTAAP